MKTSGSPVRVYAKKSYHGIRRAARHIKNVLTDRDPKLLILTYHRVLPGNPENPIRTIIRLKTFERQIDFLAGRFPVVSLEEGLKAFRGGAARTSVVLSFDDGYVDNYEIAFPLLKRKGVPAVFFVSSGYIGSGGPQWDWEVLMRLMSDPAIKKVDVGSRSITEKSGEPRLVFVHRVTDGLKSAALGDLRRTVDNLRSISQTGYDFFNDRCLEWDHLKRISDEGMEIGSHGISHRSLAMVPVEDARREITESRRIISERIGKDCRFFAFPFGSARDYNSELIDIVSGSGYESCLLNAHGYNHPSKDLFSLKRLIMDEETPLRFIFG